MPKQILKRSGSLESWDINKVREVVKKALCSSNCDLEFLEDIVEKINVLFKWKRLIPQEDVQDAVENVLMENGYKQAAKNFILYREKRRVIRESNNLQLDVMETITDYIGHGDWRIKKDLKYREEANEKTR